MFIPVAGRTNEAPSMRPLGFKRGASSGRISASAFIAAATVNAAQRSKNASRFAMPGSGAMSNARLSRLRCSPPRRTELAKGVVLSCDALEVEQEMAFAFARAFVSRRELGAVAGERFVQQIVHTRGAEDEITWQHAARRLEQRGPRAARARVPTSVAAVRPLHAHARAARTSSMHSGALPASSNSCGMGLARSTLRSAFASSGASRILGGGEEFLRRGDGAA